MQMDYVRNKREERDKREEGCFFPSHPSESLRRSCLNKPLYAAFSELLKRKYKRSTVTLFMGDSTNKNSIKKPFCWLRSIRSVSLSGNTMTLFSLLIKVVRDDLPLASQSDTPLTAPSILHLFSVK